MKSINIIAPTTIMLIYLLNRLHPKNEGCHQFVRLFAMICAAGRGMSLRGCQPYTVRRSAEPMATRLKGGFLDGAQSTTTYKYPLSSKLSMKKGAIQVTFETLVYAILIVVLMALIGIAIRNAVQRFFP